MFVRSIKSISNSVNILSFLFAMLFGVDFNIVQASFMISSNKKLLFFKLCKFNKISDFFARSVAHVSYAGGTKYCRRDKIVDPADG